MAIVIKPKSIPKIVKPAPNGPLSLEEIAFVRSTLKPIVDLGDDFTKAFYNRLFELNPSLRSLFAETNMTDQGREFLKMIATVVGALDKLGDIVPVVQDLGKRHVGYGVKPEHYETVGQALIETLKSALGDRLTPQAEQAWVKTYKVLADTMKAAAVETGDAKGGTTRMTGFNSKSDASAIVEGISSSQALIEFEPDGTIVTANENFCKTMGYSLSEIEGKHHSIFADPDVARSSAYAQFWEDLRANKFKSGQFSRIAKDGRIVWLQAAYNPIVDDSGKVVKVVKNCSDITEEKLAALASEADSMRQAQMIDQMPVNVLMCDLDNYAMTYMNETSRKTLMGLESHLPIKVDDMIGSSIDVFHENPAHQRAMLADPNNLPHKTKIMVGPETLDLLVSPIMDKEGQYIGPMLTWSVITRSVKMADDFETNIKGIASAVSAASTEMQSSAESLAATAEETSNQANTVAAASEQLSSSINEISQQVSRSAAISAEAVTEAQRSEEQIQGLAQAADKIGAVVKLINDIAGQTNLLALNATIEAARAGEAGKGFAVVASEVKNLASQTAKATDEISGQVGSIQGATRDAVAAIAGISKIINEINEISTAISSAVEEQGAATQEVATNITGVTSAASETGQSASQVLEAATELSKQSELLSVESDNFLAEMRK